MTRQLHPIGMQGVPGSHHPAMIPAINITSRTNPSDPFQRCYLSGEGKNELRTLASRKMEIRKTHLCDKQPQQGDPGATTNSLCLPWGCPWLAPAAWREQEGKDICLRYYFLTQSCLLTIPSFFSPYFVSRKTKAWKSICHWGQFEQIHIKT